MKKSKKKVKWIVLCLLLVCAGAGILMMQAKYSGYSQRRIFCEEVENEMEAASGVRPDLGRGFLTYAQVEELLGEVHLEDYITYEEQAGIKKITRDEWHKIYEEILDYLEAENKVFIKEVLVLECDREKNLVFTNKGTYSAKGTGMEEFEKYRLYVSEDKILGIVEKKSGKAVLSNVFLQSFQKQNAEILFDKREYSLHVEGDADTMKNTVCDLVFEDGKIREIHKKEETINGNLITLDQKEIEIEGYGKIPLAERVPAYKLYGTVEEKSLEDIVIGNMSVQYVVGEGMVQAVLLKEPADIQNIRVLLLNGNIPYYENVYLTSDQPFETEKDGKKKSYEAGHTVSAKELTENEEACRVLGREDGRMYLTKEDGSRTTLGYAGNLIIRKKAEGYTVVNEVSFEDYVCGVLPSEMPEKFDSEALKAQAVCARSYAYMQLMKGDYAALGAHIDDSTNYQVYNKQESGEKSRKAVQDTAGLVMKYEGKVVEAYYYSTSCGHTGTMEDWNQKNDASPYLKNIWVKEGQEETDLSKEKNFRKYITKADDACFDGKVPYFRWTASLDFNGKDEEVRNILTGQKQKEGKNVRFYCGAEENKKKTLKGFGAVTGVSVQKRGKSGAIKILKIDFENGTALVKNEYNIRRVLGAALVELTCQDGPKNQELTVLPSAYAILSYDAGQKKASVSGGGFGHGIGMSQHGAEGMAKAGYACDEILEFFYQDIEISSIY